MKQNFLTGLAPLEERQGKGLLRMAEDYFNKKNRKAKKKDPQVKKQSSNIQWDFTGSSGGDQGHLQDKQQKSLNQKNFK